MMRRNADLGDRQVVAKAVHEACQVVVHVVKHHVDAALEVVAPVSCTNSASSAIALPRSAPSHGCDSRRLPLRCRLRSWLYA